MVSERRQRELEFELAVTGVLDDIYDLRVRTERDPLNRRRNGYTTLDFEYRYPSGDAAVVEVCVKAREWPGLHLAMKADFSSQESVYESAESCEDLALELRERFDAAADRVPPCREGRRLED